MSKYLGFEPTEKKSGYYFISYNSEDEKRVSSLLEAFCEYKVDLWYDYGIKYGRKWKRTISKKIRNSEKVLLFLSNGVFEKATKHKNKDSWVYKEYQMAKELGKDVLIIVMDEIDAKSIPDDLFEWWIEIKDIHCFQMYEEGKAETVKRLACALSLDKKESVHDLKEKSTSQNLNQAESGTNRNEPKRGKRINKKAVFLTLFTLIFVVGLVVAVISIIDNQSPPDRGNSDTTYSDSPKYVLFGSYPQSRVKDSETLAALSAKELNWKSFDYYSGNGFFDGSMTVCNIAHYADVKYKGVKYRAVRFDEYRPSLTSESINKKIVVEDANQTKNGYFKGKTYWFEYEPIKWIVLDEISGLAVSEKVLDSQPYTSVLYEGTDGKYYKRSNEFANVWRNSELRTWLNTDFFETAFDMFEKKDINTSLIELDSKDSKAFANYNDVQDKNSTNDNVFILSSDDWTNAEYRFLPSPDSQDALRTAFGTDYAKSQNLDVFMIDSDEYPNSVGKSYFSVRTAGKTSRNICYIDATGCINDSDFVNDTSCGVRPAVRINLNSNNVKSIAN